jgi:alanyl-tRNA synthetase
MGFRGGSRMEMACGRRAYEMLNAAFDQNRQVSQAFSAQITATGEAARRMNEVLAQQKYRIAGLEKQIFILTAKGYAGRGDVVHFEEDLEPAAVRDLADAIGEVCGGTAAVFSGSDGSGYSYCLVSRQGDLRQLGKAMTQALRGRGGGKPGFQQGRVQAAKAEIVEFFANL